MTEEKPAAWERQPYETPAAWAYFRIYLEQDPPRSINAAYRAFKARKGHETARAKQAPGSWRAIANGKRQNGEEIPGAMTWEQRAAAWEDHLDNLDRQKWAARRRELKEKEWEAGSALLAKAEQMLLFPVMAQKTEDETGTTIILPADWKLRDIPAVVLAASRISRLAAEMSTDNVSVDWREEARKEGISNPDAIYRKLVEHFENELEGSDDERSLPGSQEEPGEVQE